MTDSTIDFAAGTPAAGTLAVSWIHGAPARQQASDPPVQVHRYDEHTVILRQSKSVHYEAPFLYLLFGNDRALLLDTGATADPAKFPLRATVDGLVDDWLTRHPREDYQLVVVHTHGHGDHVAGDAQFAGRPGAPPGRDHRLRPVDRLPAHRRHRVPRPPVHVRLPAVPGQPGPDDRPRR